MTDVHKAEIRSYNMSQIRSKNTGPEIVVRKWLFSKGFRYRLNKKDMPGKPDIVLTKYKTIININGCFWHGHKECKYFKLPKTRRSWWLEKINATIERDIMNNKKLQDLGWKVHDVWECELKGDKKKETLQKLSQNISCQS